MNNYYRRYPRITTAFFMVPVLFNLFMWQNYSTSAECLLPAALLNCGSAIALFVFGFGFGIFTALFANICLVFVLSLGTVLKNKTINEHMRRHSGLYATLWILPFTFAGFAGFITMVFFRDPNASSDFSNLFFTGTQGFLAFGVSAGTVGILVAAIITTVVDSIKKHIVVPRTVIEETPV